MPFVLTVSSFHLQTADTRAETESLSFDLEALKRARASRRAVAVTAFWP